MDITQFTAGIAAGYIYFYTDSLLTCTDPCVTLPPVFDSCSMPSSDIRCYKICRYCSVSSRCVCQTHFDLMCLSFYT